MKLSFSTLGCPAWSVERIVEQAAALGYDGVELRGIDREHVGVSETKASRAAIRKRFADAGVEVCCLMGYCRLTFADAAQQQAQIDGVAKVIELAHDLGAPLLRIFGGQFDGDDRNANIARVATALNRLAPIAERAGVKLAMETHDDWCLGQVLTPLFAQVKSPAVGITWDIANSFLLEPIEHTFEAVRPRLMHVHFKDARRMPGGKSHSELPGKGEVPMRKALELLKRVGYDGYLSFEWEKKWESDLAEPEVAFPHYLSFTTALMRELGVKRG